MTHDPHSTQQSDLGILWSGGFTPNQQGASITVDPKILIQLSGGRASTTPPQREELEKARLTRESKEKTLSYVTNRSSRRTPECFLSSGLCKGWIMLAKGKAPKVQFAVNAGAGW